ncbi:DUF2971 domain-containing protein [Sinorhizobium meliloti]|nr:DUF2971 domain-containing protein [Sinorhizobium meliloti]
MLLDGVSLSLTYGIVCLSDNWQHPMMWSHYADRHRGICLAFDVVGTRPIIPISYTDLVEQFGAAYGRRVRWATIARLIETCKLNAVVRRPT